MDGTLTQILRTLIEYSQTIDQLRARVAELEQAARQTEIPRIAVSNVEDS